MAPPFERIAFGILDPLPWSANGNKYILVVMDYFTKRPEAYPIPDKEASTIEELLFQQMCPDFEPLTDSHLSMNEFYLFCV